MAPRPKQTRLAAIAAQVRADRNENYMVNGKVDVRPSNRRETVRIGNTGSVREQYVRDVTIADNKGYEAALKKKKRVGSK